MAVLANFCEKNYMNNLFIYSLLIVNIKIIVNMFLLFSNYRAVFPLYYANMMLTGAGIDPFGSEWDHHTA